MSDAEPVAGGTRVVRSPNFRLHDDAVYFDLLGIHRSRTPVIGFDSDEARELYAAIGDGRALAELSGGDHARQALLERWRDAGAVAFIEPVVKSAAPRPRVLVFEPHMDDAALSLGGMLWARRADIDLQILTFVRHSEWTSYSAAKTFPREAVTALRIDEQALFIAMLDAEWTLLDDIDFPLIAEAGSPMLSDPADLAARAGEIHARVGQPVPDEIWLPLGIGFHPDHLRVREIALTLLATWPDHYRASAVYLYADQPYVMTPAKFALPFLRDSASAAPPEPWSFSPDLAAKMRLLTLYASQFKDSVMRGRLTRDEKRPHVETAYRLRGPAQGAAAGAYEVDDSAGWIARHAGPDQRPVTLTLLWWKPDAPPLPLKVLRIELAAIKARFGDQVSWVLVAPASIAVDLAAMTSEFGTVRAFPASRFGLLRAWLHVLAAAVIRRRPVIVNSAFVAVPWLRRILRVLVPTRRIVLTPHFSSFARVMRAAFL